MPGDRKGVAGFSQHDQRDPCQVTEKTGLITEHDQCDPCQVTEKRRGLDQHDQCDTCQVTEKAGLITENDQCDPCQATESVSKYVQIRTNIIRLGPSFSYNWANFLA